MDWQRKLRAKTIRPNRAYKRDMVEALADGFVPHQDARAIIAEAIFGALMDDCPRFRTRVLGEIWEALRDDENGPHIEAMQVITKINERDIKRGREARPQ